MKKIKKIFGSTIFVVLLLIALVGGCKDKKLKIEDLKKENLPILIAK